MTNNTLKLLVEKWEEYKQWHYGQFIDDTVLAIPSSFDDFMSWLSKQLEEEEK